MKSWHFALILLLTLLTSSFVWVRLQIVNIGYALHSLEKQERALREEINGLNFRLNQARSPQRLERLAASTFKMGPPRPDQIVQITDATP